MNFREQLKQKVLDVAFTAEKYLRYLRTQNSQNRGPIGRKKKEGHPSSPGEIKSYHNNSKEERKLH